MKMLNLLLDLSSLNRWERLTPCVLQPGADEGMRREGWERRKSGRPPLPAHTHPYTYAQVQIHSCTQTQFLSLILSLYLSFLLSLFLLSYSFLSYSLYIFSLFVYYFTSQASFLLVSFGLFPPFVSPLFLISLSSSLSPPDVFLLPTPACARTQIYKYLPLWCNSLLYSV